MKTLTLISLILLISLTLEGQCTFDPTINGELILCPNSSTTLSTQTYDKYQWYRREYSEPTLSPIQGDTLQTISVSNPDDVLYYYAVEATLDGCTELSPEVLLDGWAFLPVTVTSTGDFQVGNSGESLVCIGDTMFFTINLPYNTNITWFKNGTPIAGEDSTTLTVTSEGQYTVTGAPDICPDYQQSLGLTLEVVMIECSTGTDEQFEEDESIVVYPNPAFNQINVESENEIIQYVNLFNNLGQLIHHENVFGYKKSIDVSTFDQGIYWLEINKKEKKEYRKIIINR